jgi:mannosyltransferase
MRRGLLSAILIGFQLSTRIVRSLWIDELGTHWVISGTLTETVERAWTYHGQTLLYYLVLKVWTLIGGTSEVALRVPSLVALATATVVLYRFVRRIAGGRAAALSIVAFLMIPSVSFTATDARPYAFALLGLIV